MNQSLVASIRARLLKAGRWSLLLCLFSVPINKPATNIFIFFALLFAILGERARQRFEAAWKQPIVVGAVVWFLILLVSTFIAPEGEERWKALSIYRALFYPMIVAALFETQKWRNRGLLAFGISASLVLVISWAEFFWTLLHGNPGGTIPVESYTVFKNYTQQGVIFVVLAAMAAAFANTETDPGRKRLLWFVTGAAFVNVVFLLQSRTGYLVAAPFLLYWVWHAIARRHSGWKSVAISGLVVISIGAAAALTPSVRQRIEQIDTDYSRYAQSHVATSLGVRLELWKRTMPIIASAPIMGHGLGQWRPYYQSQIIDNRDLANFLVGHPHQEALLILSEQGIVGFGVFVCVLFLLWRYIRKLEPPHRDFYTVLLLIYITAGLVNCVLADFAHRHVFLMLLACIPCLAVEARTRKTTV